MKKVEVAGRPLQSSSYLHVTLKFIEIINPFLPKLEIIHPFAPISLTIQPPKTT